MSTCCSLGDGKKLRFWTDRWIDNCSVSELAPQLMSFVKPARLNDSVAQALHQNSWARSFRGTPSVPAIVEYLEVWNRVSMVVLNEEERDSVTWKLTANGMYSSKSAYDLFFLGRTEVPAMRQLWESGAPLKFKLHMWLALKNKLWTSDRLEERGLEHHPHCALCCQEPESIEHLTLQCSYAREVWYNLLLPHNLQRFMPSADAVLEEWWPQLSNAVTKDSRKELNSLVVLVARSLWLERNARIFDKMAVMPVELCRRIKVEFEQWRLAKLCGQRSGQSRGIT